jgi:hypothetical protein
LIPEFLALSRRRERASRRRSESDGANRVATYLQHIT